MCMMYVMQIDSQWYYFILIGTKVIGAKRFSEGFAYNRIIHRHSFFVSHFIISSQIKKPRRKKTNDSTPTARAWRAFVRERTRHFDAHSSRKGHGARQRWVGSCRTSIAIHRLQEVPSESLKRDCATLNLSFIVDDIRIRSDYTSKLQHFTTLPTSVASRGLLVIQP